MGIILLPFHGIIVIDKFDKNVKTHDFASLRIWNTNKFGPQSRNLGSIIRGFKIGVKKKVANSNVDFKWQARYYDRILRNENEFINVRNYIKNNPVQWLFDEENHDYNKE